MNDNLIVFPATTKYMHEARVLLKSLVKHMPNTPVHVMSRDGEADMLKGEFPNVTEVINEPKVDTEFRQIRTSRFRHAADVADQFKTVCLLDADMCCVYNFEHIFRMADTGTILTCSNNTIFRYIKKDFDHMHVECDPTINVIHTSFTTVPFFINPSLHRDYLLAIFGNKTGNDLDIPNLLAITMDKMKQVFLLNSYAWTNIHHSMIKPETHVRKVDDGYVSKQGERIFMFHGHWLDPKYVAELINPMQKNYGYHQKYVEGAKNHIRTIDAEYAKYK